MFGIRYIKSQPTTYLMQFRRGRLARKGAGLAFFYYAPVSTLVSIPMASRDRPFILELVTADFQSVTVQGQVTYRIGDPDRMTTMMDFSLAADGLRYATDDPDRLGDRVAMQAEVIIQQAVQGMALKQALQSSAGPGRASRSGTTDRNPGPGPADPGRVGPVDQTHTRHRPGPGGRSKRVQPQGGG